VILWEQAGLLACGAELESFARPSCVSLEQVVPAQCIDYAATDRVLVEALCVIVMVFVVP
jgi:hypothetical protein